MSLSFKVGMIEPAGGDPRTKPPKKLATRTCDLRGCNKTKNLQKCARCSTAMYCSKECQKADWAHHKRVCKLATEYAPAPDPETGNEPALRRHLRHWTSRFNGSLLCAAIVALELNNHPENIDTRGLVVKLRPRPHANVGARFELGSAVVLPMMAIEALMSMQTAQARSANAGPTVMELHKQHRDELKQRSGGREDYITAVVVANNHGNTPLPGGMETEIRFKPLQVHRELVESAQLNDPTLDWLASLQIQINRDIPNQAIVR